MKNILLLAITVLAFASCGTIKMGKEPDANPKPFVQLKDNTLIQATQVTKGLVGVIADGKQYKFDKVAFYSNGEQSYAMARGASASLLFTGDISVYGQTHMYVTSHTANERTFYFLNKSGTNEILPLRMKNVKKLVPEGDPGRYFINKGRQNSIAGKACIVGGLAAFVGGIILASNNTNVEGSQAKTGRVAGGITITAGVLAPVVMAPIFGRIRFKCAQKAIARHNHVF